MKLKFLFFVFFLIPIAQAAMFDGWVTEKHPITLDGKNYTIMLNSDKDMLLISSLGLYLENETCKTTIQYEVCFNGTRFDLDEGYGEMDENADKELHQAKVKVERIVQELSIQRNLSSRYLAVEGVETIYVTITPSKTVKNVQYIEILPEGVQPLKGVGVEIEGQMVKMETYSLDKPKTFSYNIKLIESRDIILDDVKLTYTYNGTDKTVIGSELNIVYSIKVEGVDQYINDTLNANKTKEINETVEVNETVIEINEIEEAQITGEATEEIISEEPGFLTRFINKIANFFDNLFN